jgi:oligosaccharyltransferase complex subunit beta
VLIERSLAAMLLARCAAMIALAAVALAATQQPHHRTLVLVEDMGIQFTHSAFFGSLKGAFPSAMVSSIVACVLTVGGAMVVWWCAARGHELAFRMADNANLALTRYGERLYDNLIIFAPSVEEFGGDVSVQSILQFIDDGGNVLVGASSTIGSPLRELASDCGVEFDEEKTFVIDHLHYDVSDPDGQHTLIVADDLSSNKLLVGDAVGKPVLFRGVGMTFDAANPLAMTVLRGSPSSYSFFPDEKMKEFPHAVGKNTLLVVAVQARNNARMVFSGSIEMFSDQLFSVSAKAVGSAASTPSGNKVFSEALSAWNFKEVGVLRARNVAHKLQGGESTPAFYTIKEDIEYRIVIEELRNGQWVPYVADDVQLEFVRIDPHVRTTLKYLGHGTYGTEFVAPDVYGIFQFKVDYKRRGYTYLFSTVETPVRPLRHNQYERFLLAAYPYYVSALSMLAGLFLFSLVFLYHKDKTN